MSLPVPLTVRVGNRHITKQVAAVSFVKEAIGGVKSISFRLARPLDRLDPDLAAYSRVYVYDARNATTIAEGRISDQGRGASASDGQQWDIVCFGPAVHATDNPAPVTYVDTSLARWTLNGFSTDDNATTALYEIDADAPGVRAGWHGTVTIPIGGLADAEYRGLLDTGQTLGSIRATWRAGVTDANWRAQISTRTTAAGGASNAVQATWTTAGGTLTAVHTTDFAATQRVAILRIARFTSTVVASATSWLKWKAVSVRAALLDKDGTTRTGIYSAATLVPSDVVRDVLGRVLDQYDGANATVDTTSAYAIDQLMYADPATPEQILGDLMALVPTYRWYAGASNAAGKYAFTWAPYPTTVRYEATLDDGGSFPNSSQELYNRCIVRFKDPYGRPRTYGPVSAACKILDDASVVRTFNIDLAEEYGSIANATQTAAQFLAAHSVPSNSGTLTIARRIRDLTSGRMVSPHEIEPGELIRVRGIEGYSSALNTNTNDGQTVFRIWSMSYSSDTNAATLELDSPARTTANALKKAMKMARRPYRVPVWTTP